MATKKTEEINNTPSSNSNVNTNNINVNVKVERPRTSPSKTSKKQKEQPNWVLKAIVIGAIGLAVSLIGYYFKNQMTKEHKPPIIENGTTSVQRDNNN